MVFQKGKNKDFFFFLACMSEAIHSFTAIFLLCSPLIFIIEM